jgi:hypothetical protein
LRLHKFIFTEERGQEDGDHLGREVDVVLGFGLSGLEGDRHECKLKHTVLGLVLAARSSDLLQSCLHNLDLLLNRSIIRDFLSTQFDEWPHIVLRGVELELFEEVEQNLNF